MSQTLTYVIGQDRRPHVDNVQDFKVNFDGSNTNWVQARQYERSMRQVFVNIKNEDGTPLDLTGCNVWFEGLLPKNSAGDFRIIDDKGYVALDPTAGRFRFDMPGHAFTVAGSYRQAFFRIVKDGNSITTLEFDLDVLADKVIDGLVPRTYLSPLEDILTQAEEDLANGKKSMKQVLDSFTDEVTDKLKQLQSLGASVSGDLQTVKNSLSALKDKIDQDHLFTQAEAETFKQALTDQITNLADQKVEAAIAEIKSYRLATTNIRKQISYNGYWSNLDQSHSGGVYTSSLDTIKNDIDQMAPLVDGITLIFRQYITGGKLVVLENLDIFKQAIAYAKSKGLAITGYKFHCLTSIDDIKEYGVSGFFADYKANVDKVTSALPEAGVPLILFNERGDLYGSTSPYAGNVRNVLQDLVSASYKVDISFQSLQDFISADPHIQEIVDSITINSYARISDKKQGTTLDDVADGIDDNYYALATYVHSLYPSKPLIMSEFGIKSNWAAFDETWSWDFSAADDDTTGKVPYLYLRGLMQSKTIKLFDGVWLWFYADLLKSNAGKEYLQNYKKGVI
ncbi:phage baseplate upper protein [Limosilactobacillus reuteri]|uniref:phage baseplate upper protein n=1 Tax=Limosilactobacillus reuteri TaxID=1598 RepID=UPI0024BAC029|nr:phage baseplate upper protein [Limosilactobacillus reuteri]